MLQIPEIKKFQGMFIVVGIIRENYPRMALFLLHKGDPLKEQIQFPFVIIFSRDSQYFLSFQIPLDKIFHPI